MRKPQPERFEPSYKARQPDEVNMSGIVPLKPRHKSISPSIKDKDSRSKIRELPPKRKPLKGSIHMQNGRVVAKSQTASKRTHVHKYTSTQKNKSTSKHVYMYTFLALKPASTATFRLPPEIMEKFDEVYFSAKSQYKSKLKRYAVIVAALSSFFWDFENKGKQSDFYKCLIEESD